MDITTLINNVVNQIIVRPSGDPYFIGSKGFVFDILGDEEAMFDSDITDHYVEQNYAIQDHISLRPPKFTLTGYIGELNDIFQNTFLNILTTIQSMSAIADYTLVFGSQATQIYDALAAISSQVGVVVNQSQNVYNTITGSATSATRQQLAYNKFVELYMNRQLCTVETPWATWSNMGIESIRVVQKDDSRYVSEFSVTFKQIRTVNPPQVYQPVGRTGRVLDYSTTQSIIAGSVSGQTQFTDGTSVDTDYLTQKFQLPNGSEVASYDLYTVSEE